MVLVVLGSQFLTVGDPRLLLVCEGIVLLETIKFSEAIELLFGLYYILNLQYPMSCECTYTFFQKHIMNVQDAYKVPTRLVSFVEKL